jgi:hypothetical protein
MKFMMVMIPAVYQGGKRAPGFTSDPREMEERGQRNEGLGSVQLPLFNARS